MFMLVSAYYLLNNKIYITYTYFQSLPVIFTTATHIVMRTSYVRDNYQSLHTYRYYTRCCVGIKYREPESIGSSESRPIRPDSSD